MNLRQQCIGDFDAILRSGFTDDYGNQHPVCETAKARVARPGPVPGERARTDQVICRGGKQLGIAQHVVNLNGSFMKLVTRLCSDATDIGENFFALKGAERFRSSEQGL